MDTVVWNFAPQDPRLAYAAPHGTPWNAGHDAYLASTLSAHYGTPNAPGPLHSPTPEDGLRASATSTPSPHSPSPSLMHTDAHAGQDASTAWMPSTILQPPLGTELGGASPQGHVETPMISLRAASPATSTKDADAAALMGLLGATPRMYAPPPPPPQAPQAAAVSAAATGAAPLGLGAPKAASTSPVASPAALGPHADVRRRDSAQLRHFLKLDVDMGFVSDGKNESPTLLQPTSGWKKRRSVSDVGPRTPSMLGGTLDAPIISPMDDMAFLLPDVPMPPARDAPRPEAPHDTALHFASLNLHVADDVAPQAAHAAAPHPSHTLAAPSGHAPSASAPDVLAVTGARPALSLAPPGTALGTAPTSPVTLDPTLIQQHAAPMLPFHAALASPSVGEAAGAPDAPAHTGPIRPRGGARTARSTSPYGAPARSATPDGADADDPHARMAQWRFPFAGDAPGASLHPLDAYARAGLADARMPSAPHARTRRHLRAAVSEDWARAHGAPLAAWAPPGADPSRAVHVGGGGAPRRAPSPDAALWAAAQASQQLLHAQQREGAASPTPSDAAPSSRSSAPQLSPGSSTSASSPEGKPPVQTAAQTRTPVVTTSAAQAASALRRKTEALFTCPFPDCGSTFTRQYNLRGHMRSHMDQRPFKCDWPGCGRSFARTHDCKRHHNLHLNIKPYACESCGKTFARLDALNRHHKSEAGSCGAQSDARDSSGTPA